MKNNVANIDLNLTKDYFCDKLCRLMPLIQSFKSFKIYTLDEALTAYDKFLKNLTEVSEMYHIKELPHLIKWVEIFINQNPSIILKCILEANMFPNQSSLLFNKFELKHTIVETLNDYKIDFLDEDDELIGNYMNIKKESFVIKLRNKSRQLRESKQLFEALSILVMEGNQTEKNRKKKKKSCLTNLFLKNYFTEVMNYIYISFELEMFSYFELDYMFYAMHCVLAVLEKNTEIVAYNFADNMMKQDDLAKNPLRVALNLNQRMIVDEVIIYDGLKNVVKGMCLICRYLKVKGLIANPQSESLEKMRIANRLKPFRNHRYFVDLTYETFANDIKIEPEEKENILVFADSCFKQGLKVINELKTTDINFRSASIYSNEYLDSLCKVIISNNLILSKVKKLSQPVKLAYNTTRYNCCLPILEIN
jgi:hypothetical protein